MTGLPKGTAVDTTNLQPGELIHLDLGFYNVTFVCGFNSMFTFLFAKNKMIWVFHTAYKRTPFQNIRFIQASLKNEQHP